MCVAAVGQSRAVRRRSFGARCRRQVPRRPHVLLFPITDMDRTLEYHQIVASRQMGAPPSYKARPPVQKSEFAAAASTIGADIARTAGKLGKLTQLAQSKSLFEDPMAEINELTHIIKQDITALNGKLTGLQGAMADATRPAGSSEHRTRRASSRR